MNPAVQEAVDRLAAQLCRPTVLEDRTFRLIAHSAHDRPVDTVRGASILQRHASDDVSRFLAEIGVPEATCPVRVPANDQLDMRARVCVPVRHRDTLLAYLWFVDVDHVMSDADVQVSADRARELGALLYRDSVAGVPSSERVAELLRGLLTGSPAATLAARELEDGGLIRTGDGIVATVVEAHSSRGRDPVSVTDSVVRALIGLPHLFRRGSALHLSHRDRSLLLLSCGRERGDGLVAALQTLLQIVHDDLSTAGRDVDVVIGVGSHQQDLVDAAQSHDDARMAAMTAAAVPSIGRIAHWSQLGIYQIAARLATGRGCDRHPHVGLQALLEDPDSCELLETLETYLDTAGNAQATADVLHLHRSSLYYRLRRVEELAHTDLKDGMERLALHLTLKVARLTGRLALPGPDADLGGPHLATPAA